MPVYRFVHVSMVFTETSRGRWISWKWSYGWLWASCYGCWESKTGRSPVPGANIWYPCLLIEDLDETLALCPFIRALDFLTTSNTDDMAILRKTQGTQNVDFQFSPANLRQLASHTISWGLLPTAPYLSTVTKAKPMAGHSPHPDTGFSACSVSVALLPYSL